MWNWGGNYWGQLGDNQESGNNSSTPVRVLHGEQDQDPCQPSDYLKHIIGISAGRSGQHSLAVDVDGYSLAWGYNKYGQCGNGQSGDNERELTPVYVRRGEQPVDTNDPNDRLKHIVDICAGSDQSIALEKDDPADQNFCGCVYTWGTNWWGDEDYESGWIAKEYGLLGTGSIADLNDTPVRVHSGQQHPDDPNQPYLNHIVAVTAGWDHCLALEKDDPYDPNIYNPTYTGRVYAWGNNGRGYGGGYSAEEWEASVGGRLGDGTTTSRSTPVLVLKGEQETSTSGYLEHIVAISAGEGHSMALDNKGNIFVWGDNQYGQLGNGCNDPCAMPVRVIDPKDPNLPLSGIIAISAGHWHSLAIDAKGVIWMWGKGSAGRLGLGNKTIDCNTPHRIPAVYNITQETFAFAIQPALNDANEGDVLEASRGIYYENVVIHDANITLKSQDPEDPEVVADTIVDARYNAGDEDKYYYAVDFNSRSGATLAGLMVSESTKRAVNCVNLTSAYLSNCVIQDNSWDGIYSAGSSVDIIGCEIRRNASASYPDCYGIYCISDSNLNVANCVIAENEASAIWCQDSRLGLTNSIIEDNADYGIYEACPVGATVIANTIVRGNGDDGIYFWSNGVSSGPQIKNNWIYDNGGSGVKTNYTSSAPDPLADIVNNTIVNNDANGIASSYATDVVITNCIIWNNGADELYAGDSATFTVSYSCIKGGYTGTENIESDPCFVDADVNDFHLGGGSPCIDTGDPYFEPELNETDIDGGPRVMDGDANDTVIVDMGADEFWPADFSRDGFVNFIDYALLTAYWRDAGVDYNDVFLYGDSNSPGLKEFCEDWLRGGGSPPGPMPLMAGQSGGGMAESLSLQAAPSELTDVEKEAVVAEPVDVEKLLDWLAEVWLDPEVQQRIDAEAWLRLYQSLKE